MIYKFIAVIKIPNEKRFTLAKYVRSDLIITKKVEQTLCQSINVDVAAQFLFSRVNSTPKNITALSYNCARNL